MLSKVSIRHLAASVHRDVVLHVMLALILVNCKQAALTRRPAMEKVCILRLSMAACREQCPMAVWLASTKTACLKDYSS